MQLHIVHRTTYEIARHLSIDDDNAYFASIRKRWGEALREVSYSCRSRTGCAAGSTPEPVPRDRAKQTVPQVRRPSPRAAAKLPGPARAGSRSPD